MTDDTNRFIHEKIMGKCWHECKERYEDECLKCNHAFQDPITYEPFDCRTLNPDYTQWEHYGPMLEELKQNTNFDTLMMKLLDDYRSDEYTVSWYDFVHDILLTPTRGCQAIVEFFGGKNV